MLRCLSCKTTFLRGATPVPPALHLVQEQAPPVANSLPAVWELVQTDFKARDAEGRRKYGVPLQPMNSRNALIDAYQEQLDSIVYTRQCIEEVGYLRRDLEGLQAHLQDCGAENHANALEALLQKYAALLGGSK